MVKKISYAAQRYCKPLDNFFKQVDIKEKIEDAEAKEAEPKHPPQ